MCMLFTCDVDASAKVLSDLKLRHYTQIQVILFFFQSLTSCFFTDIFNALKVPEADPGLIKYFPFMIWHLRSFTLGFSFFPTSYWFHSPSFFLIALFNQYRSQTLTTYTVASSSSVFPAILGFTIFNEIFAYVTIFLIQPQR